MSMGTLNELVFNTQLAAVLRDTNARWRADESMVRAERRRGGKQIDIEIADPRLRRVAIELAYGGDRDADAKARLAQDNDIDTAISVDIPAAYKAMSETGAKAALEKGHPLLRYAVLQEGYRFPKAGYIEGTARDLAAIIPVAAVTRQRLAALADEVVTRIDSARERLESAISPSLAEQLVADVYQRSKLSGFRTMLVLWLDAMLVQAHLHAGGQDVDHLPLPDEVRPSTLIATWRKVLTTNWHSIFKPAVDALAKASRESRNGTTMALRELLHAVEAIEAARLGDHINIAAELFPKLSEDRKEAAAFYTTPATAELVAALLIRDEDGHDWRDPSLFVRMRVADLACGTGSLLRAAYHRVRGMHERHGGTSETVAAMHKGAMERGITGCDVSAIAAHLTTSSLAMMGGGEPYGSTQIGWVDVGKPRPRGLSTGSLELLAASSVDDLFADMGGAAHGDLSKGLIAVADGSLDYAIMNPPYSRTRKGQATFDIAGLTDEQREGCQKRWETLLKRRARSNGGRRDANKKAGMAASFVCLAESKLKPGGRMGMVLPVTAAASESWQPTRQMIQRLFDNVLVVAKAGASEGADALSADTNMGEMLLFGTKRERTLPASTTTTDVTAATLFDTATRQGESWEKARAVASAMRLAHQRGVKSLPITAGEDELGVVATCAYATGAPWSSVGASDVDLIAAAQAIVAGEGLVDEDGVMPFNVPFDSAERVFAVGPTHHLIGHLAKGDPIGAYEMHEIRTPAQTRGADCALWRAEAPAQTKLLVAPTHRGIVFDPKKAAGIRKNRGRMHYARGMRWTSQALLVATTERRTHGGRAWVTLGHANDDVRKAFALWGNSTIGMVNHWTQAPRNQKGRAPAQVDAVKAMPVPSLAKLPAAVLASAAREFDRLRDKSLRPACQAHQDPVRQEIDDAVIAMLGLPHQRGAAAVARLRDLWCAEPSVHGDNKAALRLLQEQDLVQ